MASSERIRRGRAPRSGERMMAATIEIEREWAGILFDPRCGAVLFLRCCVCVCVCVCGCCGEC